MGQKLSHRLLLENQQIGGAAEPGTICMHSLCSVTELVCMHCAYTFGPSKPLLSSLIGLDSPESVGEPGDCPERSACKLSTDCFRHTKALYTKTQRDFHHDFVHSGEVLEHGTFCLQRMCFASVDCRN